MSRPFKAGEVVQIGGESILRDYLACVVTDFGDSVFCVTLGTGNLAGIRTAHKKADLTLSNDWKGSWPGRDFYSNEDISRIHREMTKRGLTVGAGVEDPASA